MPAHDGRSRHADPLGLMGKIVWRPRGGRGSRAIADPSRSLRSTTPRWRLPTWASRRAGPCWPRARD